MLKLFEIEANINKYVIASDPQYGEYIGMLESIFYPAKQRARVRILACTKYPSQKAIIFDTIKERKPYAYCSLESFYFDHISCFKGEIPDYELSCKNALKAAIGDENSEFTIVLFNHFKDMQKIAV